VEVLVGSQLLVVLVLEMVLLLESVQLHRHQPQAPLLAPLHQLFHLNREARMLCLRHTA
jgi:hypothetical protein